MSLAQSNSANNFSTLARPIVGSAGGCVGAACMYTVAASSSASVAGKCGGASSCADSQRFTRHTVSPNDGCFWWRLWDENKYLFKICEFGGRVVAAD